MTSDSILEASLISWARDSNEHQRAVKSLGYWKTWREAISSWDSPKWLEDQTIIGGRNDMARKNQKIWWLSDRRWRRPRQASMVARVVLGFPTDECFDSYSVSDRLESKQTPHISAVSSIINHLEDLGYCELVANRPMNTWRRTNKQTPIGQDSGRSYNRYYWSEYLFFQQQDVKRNEKLVAIQEQARTKPPLCFLTAIFKTDFVWLSCLARSPIFTMFFQFMTILLSYYYSIYSTIKQTNKGYRTHTLSN